MVWSVNSDRPPRWSLSAKIAIGFLITLLILAFLFLINLGGM